MRSICHSVAGETITITLKMWSAESTQISFCLPQHHCDSFLLKHDSASIKVSFWFDKKLWGWLQCVTWIEAPNTFFLTLFLGEVEGKIVFTWTASRSCVTFILRSIFKGCKYLSAENSSSILILRFQNHLFPLTAFMIRTLSWFVVGLIVLSCTRKKWLLSENPLVFISD